MLSALSCTHWDAPGTGTVSLCGRTRACTQRRPGMTTQRPLCPRRTRGCGYCADSQRACAPCPTPTPTPTPQLQPQLHAAGCLEVRTDSSGQLSAWPDQFACFPVRTLDASLFLMPTFNTQRPNAQEPCRPLARRRPTGLRTASLIWRGSGNTPHFAGPGWASPSRTGTRTLPAKSKPVHASGMHSQLVG